MNEPRKRMNDQAIHLFKWRALARIVKVTNLYDFALPQEKRKKRAPKRAPKRVVMEFCIKGDITPSSSASMLICVFCNAWVLGLFASCSCPRVMGLSHFCSPDKQSLWLVIVLFAPSCCSFLCLCIEHEWIQANTRVGYFCSLKLNIFKCCKTRCQG